MRVKLFHYEQSNGTRGTLKPKKLTFNIIKSPKA